MGPLDLELLDELLPLIGDPDPDEREATELGDTEDDDRDDELDELLDDDRLLHPEGGGKKYGTPISGSGSCGARFQRR